MIPASIRDQLGIVPRVGITLQVEGGRTILDPQSQAARLRRIGPMRGYTAGGPSMADALVEERRRERERELSEEGW